MSQSPPRVGLYVHDSRADILRLVRCLRAWGLPFTTVRPDALKALKPGAVDVLLLHGGWYGIDREPGMEQHGQQQAGPEHQARADAVRAFVRAGGGIVGLCAGAYNVVWLGLIAADISRTHGVGPHALETVDAAHPIVKGVVEPAGQAHRAWKPLPVMRVNGPVFFPKHPEQMLMSYDWEHRLGALLAAPAGGGRAAAFSPHPEMREDESGTDNLTEGPLPRAALLLRNALYWSGGRECPDA